MIAARADAASAYFMMLRGLGFLKLYPVYSLERIKLDWMLEECVERRLFSFERKMRTQASSLYFTTKTIDERHGGSSP